MFAENTHFGAIINLLTLELVMCAEPLVFMVDSTNMYGGIFYNMYLLPQLAIPYFLKYKICAVEFK